MNFLRSFAWDCKCEKKMKKSYFDSSVFAMVILRAIDAGAAVIYMLLWTPVFWFNNDLGLMNPDRKKSSVFNGESIFPHSAGKAIPHVWTPLNTYHAVDNTTDAFLRRKGGGRETPSLKPISFHMCSYMIRS